MNWYLVFISAYVFWITPLSIQFLCTFSSATYPTGMCTFKIWHTGIQVPFSLLRNEEGSLFIQISKKKEQPAPPFDFQKTYTRTKYIFKMLKVSNLLKALLKAHLHFYILQMNIVLGLSDAFKTAEITAFLWFIVSLLKIKGKRNIQISPNFKNHSLFSIHCILSVRVGMILTASVLFYLAHMRVQKQIKEEQKWKKIQSEI